MKKLKKLTLLLLAVVTMLSIVTILPETLSTVNADTYGNFVYTVSNGEAEIKGYKTKPTGALTIPDTLGGYPVTSIGEHAFLYCDDIKTVTIPDSVKLIGYEAFYGCTGLTNIRYAGTDWDDFVSISGLYNLMVNGSANHLYLGNETKETKHIVLDRVRSIGDCAFSNCTGLTSITIPDSVTSIGDYAFNGCTGLKTVTIGNGVTSIGGNAFKGCTVLTSVTIPDRVKSIGQSAFYGCTGLKTVTIGNGITSICERTFYECTGLKSVTIPNSVKSIGDYAFYKCTGLTSVTIGNGVKNIYEHAFSGCTGLISITIPNSVKNIGSSTFSGCTGLTSITLPDSVKSISGNAFYGCTGLTSVTIPDGVTSIAWSAFYGCTGLSSITIPDSVTSIGYNAFYNTAYYNNSSNWENGVLYIGKYLIRANVISGSYTIKSGTKCIADEAFYNCRKLTSITIPNSVTSIGTGKAIPENAVMYVDDGSYAYYWAIKHGKSYVAPHSLYFVQASTATCTTNGNNAYYKCSVCDKVFKDAAGTKETTIAAITIKATGHTLKYIPYQAATCTTTGINAYYYCTVCEKVFTDYACTNETTLAALTIKATGHKNSKVAYKEATCTSTGNVNYYKCSVCGALFSNGAGTKATTLSAVTIKAKGHKNSKIAYKEATCTSTGNVNYYKCSVCGGLFSNGAGTKATTLSAVTIKAKGHKLTLVTYKAATCTTSGNFAYYKCSVCKKVFTDVNATNETTLAALTIKATGHKNSKVAYKEATCTSTGNVNYYKCSVCGGLFSNGAGTKATTLSAVTIKAKGHKLTLISYKAATCTTAGNFAYYKCSVCKKAFTDVNATNETTLAALTIKATGHKNSKIAYKEATCTNAGNTNYYKCSVCGGLFSNGAGTKATTLSAVTIKAKGHKLTLVPYKAPTCTTKGNNAYYKCSRCKKIFADAQGSQATTVSAQTIKTTSHNIVKVAKKAATCTETGNYTYYLCTVCNKVFVDSAATKVTTVKAQTIQAKGHKLTKVAYNAATCVTSGNNEYYVCTCCKKVFSDVYGTNETTVDAQTIEALGHHVVDATDDSPARCTRCGKTFG